MKTNLLFFLFTHGVALNYYKKIAVKMISQNEYTGKSRSVIILLTV